MKPIIRKARKGDAPQIASAHIKAWQETYVSLLPQDYLDTLGSSYQKRMEDWDRVLNGEFETRTLWVAEVDEKKVVGFVVVDRARDTEFAGYGEVGAIYLLKSHHRTGTGFELLKAGMRSLMELGYTKAYCWVLEGNPTIQFYERTGARFTGKTKPDSIGGQTVQEFAYAWDSLEFMGDS